MINGKTLKINGKTLAVRGKSVIAGINGEVDVSIECPCCKTKQKQLVTQGWNVLLCYLEENGCDRYFAINMRLEARVTIFEMREPA